MQCSEVLPALCSSLPVAGLGAQPALLQEAARGEDRDMTEWQFEEMIADNPPPCAREQRLAAGARHHPVEAAEDEPAVGRDALDPVDQLIGL
ncbi:hypothetical protein ACQR0Z_30345 [Bradyrhizobium sp. HKCCYLS3077]|uniref:hypothetical protein n=1 Tax=Bradyrhizobium sp. HKCCYLS3077 TaxID=3420761 RepID=UPI003EB7D01D